MKGYEDTEEFEEASSGRTSLSPATLSSVYISVDRGVVKAVNGVTFEVAAKEIFGIIGKNGPARPRSPASWQA